MMKPMLMHKLLDVIFPPQCLSCRTIVPDHGTLCQECWQAVSFITAPQCACCGLPFSHSYGEQALCGECLREPPSFRHARAVFRYNEHSRAMILKLKYADQVQLARAMDHWLARAAKDLLYEDSVIIPVPLHYWRLVRRRYNQSALLAHYIAKHTHHRFLPDGLLRIRATQSQTGLSRGERRDNVRGAFQINPKHSEALHKKPILLVDDVYTTGSTIEHCSRALLKAGATSVNVLTLARAADL